MYYVAVLIDNRKYHVVPLIAENPVRPATSTEQTFIVERYSTEEKSILSIAENAQIVFRGGFDYDSAIDWSRVQGAIDGQLMTIDLTTATKGKSSGGTPATSGGLKLQHDAEKYFFGVSSQYSSRHVMVRIRATIDDHSYSGQFTIHLVPQKQIFDVVMDFGSEASQIVFHQRGGSSSETLHRTRIVEKLVEYYYPHLGGATLHQRADDQELYSSQFFTRKSGAVFEPTSPAGKHGEDELLNLLTDQKAIYDLADTHMFVPNLKLAHLGAYPQKIQFKSAATNSYGAEHKRFDEIVLDLQQAVINYFIQMVLKDLKGSHSHGSQLYLSVRLLVPNVFDQQKVSTMVNKTYQGLADITAGSAEYPLAGWEVNTISESDASFLGFKREKEEESRKTGKPYWVTDRDYLIIDAGKGTIDFSILRLSRQNQLTSIFRSGFIGAGNVISYAFVDTVFTSLFHLSKEERQKAIYSICLAPHTDMVAKLAFMQIIEQFKQHYDHAKNQHYKSLSDLIPADILADIRNEYRENPGAPTLLNQIVAALALVQARQSSLKDEFGMIIDTVEALVQKIDDEVRYSGFYDPSRIEKIILTGRGFKFKRLEKSIGDHFKNAVDTTSDLKKICLTGAFSGDRINFDSNLVGYPTVYKFVTTPGKQQIRQIDKGENKRQAEVPVRDTIFHRAADLVIQKGSNIIQKSAEINRILQDALTGDENEFGETRTVTPGNTGHGPKDFFFRGEYFDNFNPDTQTVTVCGVDYKRHHVGHGRINVFYTGNEFIIRDSKNYSQLGVFPRFFQETQWVFQTLYPFLEVSGPQEVKVVKEFEDDIEMDGFY